MERYLKKLHKINQKIKDPSEFHSFADAMCSFLRSNQQHDNYIQPIIKALDRIKNRCIRAVVYDIATAMVVKYSFIHEDTLLKDFRSEDVRESVLNYLRKFKVTSFNSKIQEIVENNSKYATKGLCGYLKEIPALSEQFMCNPDHTCLSKQLYLIQNGEIFYNITHFIQFLGNESRLICHKTAEILSFFTETIESNQKQGTLETFLSKFNIRESIDIREDGYVSLVIPRSKLAISDPVNFVEFGWWILPEKSKIEKILDSKDTEKINNILSDIISIYSGKRDCIDFSRLVTDGLHRLDHNLLDSSIEEPDSTKEDVNFDCLFGHNYRKDYCGCYDD